VLTAFADKQEDGEKNFIIRNYKIYTPNITMEIKSMING